MQTISNQFSHVRKDFPRILLTNLYNTIVHQKDCFVSKKQLESLLTSLLYILDRSMFFRHLAEILNRIFSVDTICNFTLDNPSVEKISHYG
jgi:hypothetical protein